MAPATRRRRPRHRPGGRWRSSPVASAPSCRRSLEDAQTPDSTTRGRIVQRDRTRRPCIFGVPGPKLFPAVLRPDFAFDRAARGPRRSQGGCLEAVSVSSPRVRRAAATPRGLKNEDTNGKSPATCSCSPSQNRRVLQHRSQTCSCRGRGTGVGAYAARAIETAIRALVPMGRTGRFQHRCWARPRRHRSQR